MFSNDVFYPFQHNFQFSVTCILYSANAFNADEFKNLLLGKELTLYHTIPTFNDPEKEAL